MNREVDEPQPVREEDGVLVIPLHSEVIVTERKLLVREEVRMVRRHSKRPRTFSAVVRSEVVEVERGLPREHLAEGQGRDEVKPSSADAADGIERSWRVSEIIVAIYEYINDVEDALGDLTAAGFNRDAILVVGPSVESRRESQDRWERMRGEFGEEDFGIYEEAVSKDHTLLILDLADEARRDEAVDIIEKYGPVDVDRKAEEWRTRKPEKKTASAATGKEEVFPVTEERLKIGKRTTSRGGVRLHRRVREEEVEETVQLREERLHVERRPADRPAGPDAFEEETIESHVTREEPVVEKEARVVGDVVISKEVIERPETVHGTVRKTTVEVEELEDTFRDHFERDFAERELTYENVKPAYDYGHDLGASEELMDSEWEDVEPLAREEFEAKNPGMWDDYKEAVKSGFIETRSHLALPQGKRR